MRNFAKILMTVLFIVVFVIICFYLGLIVGGAVKGENLSTTFDKILDSNWLEMFGVILFSVLSMYVGGSLQVIAHECGHLVFGLLSGYGFISFQAFGFAIVYENSRLRVRRFSLIGTLGQCLMLPPDRDSSMVPVMAYNAGGVIFNILLTIVSVLFLCLANPAPLMAVFLAITACIGLYMVIMNGIPMCVGGMPNDGYNMFKLRKNPKSKRALVEVLRMSALIKNGTRPKDLPMDAFSDFQDIDFNEPLQVNAYSAYAACLLDKGEYGKCMVMYREIIEKEKRVKFFTIDAKCELACLLYMDGKVDEARMLLDGKELELVRKMSGYMSSKQRFLCFYFLYCDGNYTAAEQIYQKVLAEKDKYLIKGEVAMDLEMMQQALLSVQVP